MIRAVAATIGILALGLARPAQPQAMPGHDHMPTASRSDSVSPEELVAKARAATEMFSDRSVAVARGYHRVGRDLPSMGEHWLSTKLLVDGIFDVTRPQILMYLNVDGQPRLTGVVYAIALAPGESPPDAFGPDAMWHEHNGSIDEEALLPQHHAVPSAATGTRVAFLHVWTRVPFSETIYSAENWALPFVRAGVPVPATVPNAAARSVSLADGARDFYLDMIGAAASAGTGAMFDSPTRDIRRIVSNARLQQRGLTAAEIGQLDQIWKELVSRIAKQSGVETAKRINGGLIDMDVTSSPTRSPP